VSEMKTVPNSDDVHAFLNCVQNPRRASDARQIVEMMSHVTNCPPKMWGVSIIGFDQYSYKRKDGSEHEFMMTGLSPRKAALTIYIIPGFKNYAPQLEKLGKFKHSVSCLYITNLANVDFEVLTEIVTDSVAVMRAKVGSGSAI
jgi:hypothetical protein